MGHQVELLPARQVRAFVRGNKDDAADARAIWLASQHSDIRRVAVKSAQQQAVLSAHRLRAHWVCVRTATINALRGLLYEFGVRLPQGKVLGLKALAARRAQIDAQLPPLMQRLVDQQLATLRLLEQEIDRIEAELGAVQKAERLPSGCAGCPASGCLGPRRWQRCWGTAAAGATRASSPAAWG